MLLPSEASDDLKYINLEDDVLSQVNLFKILSHLVREGILDVDNSLQTSICAFVMEFLSFFTVMILNKILK